MLFRSGDVSTFNGSVTLYINGVKSTYLEVKNLRPRDVEKIEYIARPLPANMPAITQPLITLQNKKHREAMSLSMPNRQLDIQKGIITQ